MHRPVHWRAALSSAQRIARPASKVAGRRYASTFLGKTTAKATGTLVRFGLAGAAVYYYNTSSVFADEPRYFAQPIKDEPHQTIDTIAEQRRAQAKQSQLTATNVAAETSAQSPPESPQGSESPEGLEEEAQAQGAFNEETGEINWDCPCLGGMAHGPCGEQFKAAFSCFVFSKEEPKGIDCIEHFKTMQDCFRQHPDVYGSELTEDDDDVVVEDNTGPAHAVEVAREAIDDTVNSAADAISADAGKVTQAVQTQTQSSASQKSTTSSPAAKSIPTKPSAEAANAGDEGGDLVPKDRL